MFLTKHRQAGFLNTSQIIMQLVREGFTDHDFFFWTKMAIKYDYKWTIVLNK